MRTVYLIRHGSIDAMRERLVGRADVALNKQGRHESTLAATACQRLGVGLVGSSPRRGAQETAGIIAAAVDCSVEVFDHFDEIDYGAWSGKLFAELAADPAWCRFNEERDAGEIPGGETLDAVSARIKSGLDAICGHAYAGDIAIVTHAEIIRGALLLAQSRSWSSWSLYQPEPASITALRW